ncbi:hypothetical protein GN956_G14075 [Arapaima gigas]
MEFLSKLDVRVRNAREAENIQTLPSAPASAVLHTHNSMKMIQQTEEVTDQILLRPESSKFTTIPRRK